jgi:FkbM family methyltransferase
MVLTETQGGRNVNLLSRIVGRIRRDARKALRLRHARRAGLVHVAPNFVYSPSFAAGSVVVDAGCSYEADFSLYMIAQHGARAFGVDPTLKHRPALQSIERRLGGRFVHVPCAIAAVDGTLTFHESRDNESGSIFQDHVNMQHDATVSYDVEALTLKSLLRRIGSDTVEMLKLDLEGAEYDLLGAVEREQLLPFKQIFVEFHHHAVSRYGVEDTRRLVSRIAGFGFSAFSLDDHNYLFQRLS